MATWAIGDIHGCFDTLKRLWRRLDFDWDRDHLWLVGDLVNRGPKSLQTLRWAQRRSKRLGDRMVVVLGNHDLHLLALDKGVHSTRNGDTLKPILRAKDRKKLLRWLRHQKFFHQEGNLVLVHAGIHPKWSLKKAARRARRLEAVLGSADEGLVLARKLDDSLMSARTAKLRETCRTFTQLRSCKKSGKHCSFTGPPEQAPPGCQPWYRLWKPEEKGVTVVTGHWAAQGLKVRAGMIALDSGCVWGGAMTAVRLEDLKIIQQPSAE